MNARTGCAKIRARRQAGQELGGRTPALPVCDLRCACVRTDVVAMNVRTGCAKIGAETRTRRPAGATEWEPDFLFAMALLTVDAPSYPNTLAGHYGYRPVF